jgi:hypothetical protein
VIFDHKPIPSYLLLGEILVSSTEGGGLLSNEDCM